MYTARKIFFFLATFFLVFFLSTSPVSAQSTTVLSPNTAPDVPQNLHTWTQNAMIEVMAAASCQITGVDPTDKNAKCLGADPKSGKIGYVQNGGGAIGAVSAMITMTYSPPLHADQYIADMSNNFGIVKKAYAQTPCTTGVGYCGLLPLLQLWKAFRDVAFIIFVVIFILVGLAIMLRIKIDARTVMTIENQIPRIIIALLLITFSFAIAGFLIDLMYVGIYLVFNFFSNASLYPSSYQPKLLGQIVQVQQNYQGDNPFGIFNNLVGIRDILYSGSGGVGALIGNLFYVKPDNGNLFIISGILDALDTAKNLGGYLLSWIFTLLGFLILAIAVLVALFRIWFMLIYAYIYILIAVMLAPLWIMGGVMPGSTINFESWMRSLLSNLVMFPTVIGMFLIGRVFMYAFTNQSTSVFVAPLIGNPVGNGGTDFQPIASLIAVGIVLMTPSVAEMMKDFLKAPTFKYTAAIGQQLSAGTAVPTRVGQGIMNQAAGTHYDSTGKMTASTSPWAKYARILNLAH